MWFVTTYEPVSLISLKLSTATSTGGKSLLVPTPFAFKMALLNVVIQIEGLEQGKERWNAIRAGKLAILGPQRIAVNNTFTRILKPTRGKPSPDPDTGIVQAMDRSIGFREYVQWQGPARIGFEPQADEGMPWHRWLTQIHYIGKRGGFIQASETAETEQLPSGYIHLTSDSDDGFSLDGTLQVMDDCAAGLSFDKVDVYSKKNMRTGKDRILRHVVLPYRMVRSSRGYTLYERATVG